MGQKHGIEGFLNHSDSPEDRVRLAVVERVVSGKNQGLEYEPLVKTRLAALFHPLRGLLALGWFARHGLRYVGSIGSCIGMSSYLLRA